MNVQEMLSVVADGALDADTLQNSKILMNLFALINSLNTDKSTAASAIFFELLKSLKNRDDMLYKDLSPIDKEMIVTTVKTLEAQFGE